MEKLLDFAQAAVEAAVRAGADYADAVCGTVRHADVGIENSSIVDCEIVRDYGLGVRAYFNGGMGASSVQSLNLSEARQCGEEAVRLARVAHRDPDFHALPDPTPLVEVAGLFDERIAGLPAETTVQWCVDAIAEARELAPSARVSGGAGFSVGEGAMASSTGIAHTSRGTQVEISIEAVIQQNGEVGFYFDYDVARQMDDFIPVGVGAGAAREALRFLGAKPVVTRRTTLVLGPLAAMQFLGAVIGGTSAENVQRRRSFLIGKEGEAIASSCLTIREEPLWPGGLASSPYDGEGVARTPMTLIDNGVLTTYLHNSYTAAKAGVPNNAHAARSGYGGGVGIGFSNMQVLPGDRTEQELIADVEDGLYVNLGGITPDTASGDISGTVDFGFLIENGELVCPVHTAMVGSDAFEMLRNIDAVSSDYREEPGTILPAMRIRDIQIAGSG